MIESAQRDSTGKDTLTAGAKLDKKGKNTLKAEVTVYRERSYDTATWLYHLVFSSHASYHPTQYPRQETESFQPSMVDESLETSRRLAQSPNKHDLSYPPSPPSPPPDVGIFRNASKSMIVWNKQTEPSHVVDRLLADWTTLTQEQIYLSSKCPNGDTRHEKFLKTVIEAKEEQEAADFEKDDKPDKMGRTKSDIDKTSSPRHPEQVPAFQWDGSVMSDFTDDNNTPMFRPPMDFESTRSESQSGLGRMSAGWELDDDLNPSNSAVKDAKDFSGLSSDLETFKDDREERSRLHSMSTDDDRSGVPRDPPKGVPRVKQVSFTLGKATKLKKKASKHDTMKKGRGRTRSPQNRTQPERTEPARAHNPFDGPGLTPARPVLDEWTNPSSNGYISPNAMPESLPRQPNYSESSQHTPRPGIDYLNPFAPSIPHYPTYAQPSGNPFDPMNFSAGPLPYHPPWPSYAPMREAVSASPPPATSTTHAEKQEAAARSKPIAREEDMLAVITAILESTEKRKKSNAEDPRLSKILQLLVVQQEQNAQAELDRAKATAEVEMKQILAARDRDDARIQQLENLIIKQRDEQQASDAKWRVERAALDEEMSRRASDAKELAEREIAAARSAKKAARKSLKFAKAQEEKRAKEEADAKVKEERKKLDKQSKERMQKYENLLEVAVEGRSMTHQNSEQPLRRTCIVDGNRSVEVAEYSANGLNSHSNTSILTSGFLRQAIYGSDTNGRVNNSRPRVWQHHHGRSHGSIASLQTSVPSHEEPFGVSPAQQDQNKQLILLPARLETSAKTTELQSSLAKIGLSARLQDLELDYYDSSSQLNSIDGAIVRSSIFWEAPSLSLGSELLSTYRTYGWRPPYARSSASGHTYFLGSQPIHAYFFHPDYKPQFSSSEPSVDIERIIIDKALIHEYALREMGHEFEETEAGSYRLDGRLQYVSSSSRHIFRGVANYGQSDIEALIERSFQMRESHFRSAFRQLDWRRDTAKETREPKLDRAAQIPRVPRSPISVVGSRTSFAASASEPENEDDEAKSQEDNEDDAVESQEESDDDDDETECHREKYDDGAESQGQNEYDEDTVNAHFGMGSSQLSTATSNVSTSLTSWSSSSNNPFRRRAETSKEAGNDGRSTKSFPSSTWDEPLILLD